jgi:hypothetical protein
MVGVDHDPENKSEGLFKELNGTRPANTSLTWLDVGYSTSMRHGGVHSCFFSGSLRSALTFLADAEIVVYLDDDDWLHEDHIAQIMAAIEGKKWAYAYSVFADGNSGTPLCADEIESVGVNKGVYAEKFGGFVRPSGMAINKLKLMHLIHLWSISPYPKGHGVDRLVFDRLRHEEHGCTGNATVFYVIDPRDTMHPVRLEFMKSKGVDYIVPEKTGSVR